MQTQLCSYIKSGDMDKITLFSKTKWLICPKLIKVDTWLYIQIEDIFVIFKFSVIPTL